MDLVQILCVDKAYQELQFGIQIKLIALSKLKLRSIIENSQF